MEGFAWRVPRWDAPWVYDLAQAIAGGAALERRVAARLGCLAAGTTVVDLGGGTGSWRRGAAGRRYVCVDLDRGRLRAFRSRVPAGLALVGDAAQCPVATASADAVVCLKVAHHLDDAQLQRTLVEMARILKPGGTLVIADAVESSRSLPRLLWRLDRGAHPRPAEAISNALPSEYAGVHVERFRLGIFHEFMLCAATRSAAADGGRPTA